MWFFRFKWCAHIKSYSFPWLVLWKFIVAPCSHCVCSNAQFGWSVCELLPSCIYVSCKPSNVHKIYVLMILQSKKNIMAYGLLADSILAVSYSAKGSREWAVWSWFWPHVRFIEVWEGQALRDLYQHSSLRRNETCDRTQQCGLRVGGFSTQLKAMGWQTALESVERGRNAGKTKERVRVGTSGGVVPLLRGGLWGLQGEACQQIPKCLSFLIHPVFLLWGRSVDWHAWHTWNAFFAGSCRSLSI